MGLYIMKRLFDTEQETQATKEKKPKKARSKKKKEALEKQPWTQDEEGYLLAQRKLSSTITWSAICKRINRQFSHTHRKAKECREHYELLQAIRSETWKPSEDLALLIAYFHKAWSLEEIGQIVPGKIKVFVHLQQLIEKFALRVIKKELPGSEEGGEILKLQFYLCISIILRGLTKDGDVPLEVIEVISKTQVKETDCLNFLSLFQLRTFYSTLIRILLCAAIQWMERVTRRFDGALRFSKITQINLQQNL
eukprot:TRINITY_DN1391_c0_g1_i2.p1 TRINITY_DN1391_c0_g1~~TRINITY_DN1391_c0_g1_i2.p1  ORF type:complete len:268 (-),score=42.03 TRINITY_DN1391_c0_g1_i2:271-1026(-)